MEANPSTAKERQPLRERPDYRTLERRGLPKKLDAKPVIIVAAKQLVLLLCGRWWEGCGHGSAHCAACRKPGLLVTQCDDGIGISVHCREGCSPVAIHQALRAMGLSVAELWL
jgi:hypothetical protein